jgi:hypothetical protein
MKNKAIKIAALVAAPVLTLSLNTQSADATSLIEKHPAGCDSRVSDWMSGWQYNTIFATPNLPLPSVTLHKIYLRADAYYTHCPFSDVSFLLGRVKEKPTGLRYCWTAPYLDDKFAAGKQYFKGVTWHSRFIDDGNQTIKPSDRTVPYGPTDSSSTTHKCLRVHLSARIRKWMYRGWRPRLESLATIKLVAYPDPKWDMKNKKGDKWDRLDTATDLQIRGPHN